MKIGYDAKRAFNNHTGLGNYSRMLIKSMLAFHPEHEYSLFTPKTDHDFEALKESLALSVNIYTPERVAHRLFHPYWRSVKVGSLIQNAELDVFHGLSHEIPLGMKKKGIKTVVTIHDLIFLRYPEWYPRLDRYFYKRKFLAACQEADVIVAISEQTADDIIQFFKIAPEKVRVIYQDVLPEFRAPLDATFELTFLEKLGIAPGYILSVGSFEERKNQKRLLKAYAQLPDDRPALLFVGRKNKHWKQLEALIKELGIQSEVFVLDQVNVEGLKVLYKHAKFTAYTSIFEGFGLPVLESLVCGTPVLAANNSCLEEVGGAAAFYVNPMDVEGTSMRMRQLLYDNESYELLKAQCPAQAAAFNFKKMANDLNKLYLSL
ncbi:MAG: glycosyltransferase family 1 protein [Sphingobacteriaceae bacterium]|nr:glycosyltransferase family 1 protein [Sphingobacteriaceae bacterium]